MSSSPGSLRASAARATWLSLFGVSFGFLEAAVVVYLRALYYPDGFQFPIVIIPDHVFVVEFSRELMTLLMLFAVAMATGRDGMDRFFVFGFLFGVWDIIYYVGLWVFLGWPASLSDWDVLFLIPVPWLAPVVYPVVIALFLVAGFVVNEWMHVRGAPVKLTVPEWSVAVSGALTLIVVFCWNWRIVADGNEPTSFPTAVFVAALATGVGPFVRAGIRAWR